MDKDTLLEMLQTYDDSITDELTRVLSLVDQLGLVAEYDKVSAVLTDAQVAELADLLDKAPKAKYIPKLSHHQLVLVRAEKLIGQVRKALEES
ncbi:MAG: hypothetical protein KAR42_16250 [candidate division Zixibacteria bacterium]|nr:hypothetical protein [candidate division Zixibacteria bacterium]